MSKPHAERQRPPAGSLYLDHVSHFVDDVEAAASMLERIGFTVTPLSTQINRDEDGRAMPAGAENRNVMLEQGYLEFLNPTLDTEVSRRMREQMARYRGVHLLAFGSPAAQEEHARLARHGFAPLPFVRLEREIEVEGGGMQLAHFGVVRVAPEKMSEGRVQFVEHLTPESLWQPRYLAHPSGATALAAAFIVADDPAEVAARYARFAGIMPAPAGRFVRLATARGALLVGRREDWQALLGEVPAAPALAGYALGCRDPIGLAAICAGESLEVRRPRGGEADFAVVRLPKALGGAWLLGTEPDLARWPK